IVRARPASRSVTTGSHAPLSRVNHEFLAGMQSTGAVVGGAWHAWGMTAAHPWSRYVAIGDSFTEGIGDPEPRSIGGHRGWADRVAEVLADTDHDFAYANLAVRGRLLQQIIDGQLDEALSLQPDLISVSAGGNDIIRPGTDPDEVASRMESLVERLR